MSLGHLRVNDIQVSVHVYSTIKFMPTCCLLFHVMIWASSVQRHHIAALLSAKILPRGCSSCNPTTWLQKILFSRHFYIFKLNNSKEMDTHGTPQIWTPFKSIPSKNIEKILEKKGIRMSSSQCCEVCVVYVTIHVQQHHPWSPAAGQKLLRNVARSLRGFPPIPP